MLPAPAPRIRRVFYSFHYADVNRVNQVRQSGKIRLIDSERVKTVQDRSLWESRKSFNAEYLRKSISKNIVGTSATCVLTGEHTWARPWCRFEIARSLLNGNGIFAVRIDHLWCIGQRCYGKWGPNPLDYIAVGKDAQGRIYVYEYIDGGWYKMESMSKQLMRWPKWLAPVANGYVQPLSTGAPIYDYDSQNGSRLLLYWANQAAKAAGR
ncbi:TIR domain-containing protein [Sphingomonas sp. BT-65]|uniref:TIR domain-containing protein n=1 Tax=Sphingomonas sp. BT-65 TaxID=2989821 RepID=UPI002235F9BE|nr:TIR domain-containing protein [Sphingomonas sp. BT-65]MCW4461374.1 TIR domain-containing protein [Sphingomonas sp. BT-65]